MKAARRNSVGFFLGACCIVYLVAAFVLNQAVPSTKSRMEIDSPSYTSQAENMERYGSFVLPGTTQCTNMMGIGYPIFLVIARAVTNHSYEGVVAVQIGLALLCILLTFMLAAHFFSPFVALFSAAFASCNLALILYPHFMLTEMLSCFVLLAALERFCAYRLYKNKIALMLSGLLFGYSIVIKGAALFYIAFLVFMLLIDTSCTWLKRVQGSFLFLLFFLIPVGGYVMRNKMLYDYYYLQTLSRVNVYHVFLEKVVQEDEHLSDQQAQDRIGCLLTGITEYASGSGWEGVQGLFFEKIRTAPVVMMRIWFLNVLKTYAGLFTNHLKVLLYPHIRGGDCSFFKLSGTFLERCWKYISFGTSSPFIIGLGIAEVVWNSVRYIFVITAFIFLFLHRRWLEMCIFGSWIFYFPLLTGFDGCGRYRSVIEVPLIIMMSFGIECLWRCVKVSQDGRAL